MEKAKGKIPEEVYNHYQGVGRFWRAYFHFDKVQVYGDLPWQDKLVDPSDTAMLYAPRDNREYVVDKCIEDLKFAVENCFGDDSYKAQINKWVAAAYLSKIALYEGTLRKYHDVNRSTMTPWTNEYGDWKSLLEISVWASEVIINSGKFKLNGNYAANFVTEKLYSNPEMIWVAEYSTNYRSQPLIITFNNTFFRIAAKKTTENALIELNEHHAPTDILQKATDIETAYKEVEQAFPKSKEKTGLVKVHLIGDEDYDAQTLEIIKTTIEHLLEKGVATKHIAVLVRKNKHIQDIAEYFQQHAISVDGKEMMVSLVSDEAFRLDASLAVRMIIGALRYLAHPDDPLNTAFLVKAYYRLESGRNDPNLDNQLFVKTEDPATLLPEALLTGIDTLRGEPLVMLIEDLYAILGLERLKDENAYVCAFFDKVTALSHSKATGIEDVLKAWDTELCAKAIHSDDINGIRLMTIHKSKGLEYDNVIIPYCDWDIERNNDTLWFTADNNALIRLS